MDEQSKILLLEVFNNSHILSLGTSYNNEPYVSMVAYSATKDYSEFYILISGLAKHTKNILKNNRVSLMICQPETESDNPQTLARISISGNAILVEKTNANYLMIKNNYLNKNPAAEMYFSLDDFQLYKIEVEKARYVAGFAKTFNLTKTSLQILND